MSAGGARRDVPPFLDDADWSEVRHYSGTADQEISRTDTPERTIVPGLADDTDLAKVAPRAQADKPARSEEQARRPLAGPGDSAIFAVALATGNDAVWSTTSYHGPRRHRPTRATSPVQAGQVRAAPDQAAPDRWRPKQDIAAQPAAPTLMTSSAQMAIASMASRITGFLRTFALAAVLGGGTYSLGDAYNLANTLPNMVYEIMLGGVLTSVVIPILVKAQHDDADDGVGYTQRLLSLTVAGLGVGTILAVLAAPLLIDFFGGPGHYQAVATLWATLLLPEIFFYGLGAILSAVLNTRNVYGWPAWAPVLNNIITIATVGVFVLVPGPARLSTGNITNTQILIMGIGTTLGIAAQAVVLLVPLRKIGFSWQWRFRASANESGRISEFRSLAVWILGYVAISQVGVVVISKVATPLGGVSVFTYADLLFQVPYGILGVSLLTALMPRMSRAAATGNIPAVLADLSLGARLSSIALIPITAGLIVFGPALTSVILLDKFSLSNARLTGTALAASAFGLLPFAFVMLQQRVFYAMRDTKTPTLINLAMVGTKVALVLAANQVFASRGVIISLSVATSMSYLIGAVVGQVLLKRRFGLLGFRPVARTLGWIGLATVPAALAGLAIVWVADGALGVGRASGLLELLFGGGIALAILLVIASRLPLPEIAGMRSSISSRRGRQ